MKLWEKNTLVKRAGLLALSGLFVVGIAACGDGDDNDDSNGGANSSAELKTGSCPEFYYNTTGVGSAGMQILNEDKDGVAACTFFFNAGDTVSFYIGDPAVATSVKVASKVTGVGDNESTMGLTDIVNTDLEARNLASLLEYLDTGAGSGFQFANQVNFGALRAADGTLTLTAEEGVFANAVTVDAGVLSGGVNAAFPAPGAALAAIDAATAQQVVGGGALLFSKVCIDENSNGCDDEHLAGKAVLTNEHGIFKGLKGSKKHAVTSTGGYNRDALVAGQSDPSDSNIEVTVENAGTYYMPFTGMLQAPKGSNIVTPMTSMIQALGGDAAAAETVRSQLGIDPGVDLTRASSLSNKSAATNLEAVSRLMKQASASLSSAAGVDTSAASSSSFALFGSVMKGFATKLKEQPAPLNLADTSKSAALSSLVGDVIGAAYSSVQNDTLFDATKLAKLKEVDAGGISAIASAGIVEQVQSIAVAMDAIDSSAFVKGKKLSDIADAMKAAGVTAKLTDQDRFTATQFAILADTDMRALITPANVSKGGGDMLTSLENNVGKKMKDMAKSIADNGLANSGGAVMTNITSMFSAVNVVNTAMADKGLTFTPIAASDAGAAAFNTKMLDMMGKVAGAMNVKNDTAALASLGGQMLAGLNSALKDGLGIVDTAILSKGLAGAAGGMMADANFAKLKDGDGGSELFSKLNQQVGEVYGGVENIPQDFLDKNKEALEVVGGSGAADDLGKIKESAVVPHVAITGVKLNNATGVTVSSNGTFTVSSFAQNNAYLGGLETISFSLATTGRPFGVSDAKFVSVGMRVMPSNTTADKRVLAFAVDKVKLNLSTDGAIVSAEVPTDAHLFFSAKAAQGVAVTGSFGNSTAANMFSYSSGKFTINVGSVTSNLSSSMASALGTVTGTGTFKVEAVMTGIPLSGSKTDGTYEDYGMLGFSAGTMQVGGRGISGTVTVQ